MLSFTPPTQRANGAGPKPGMSTPRDRRLQRPPQSSRIRAASAAAAAATATTPAHPSPLLQAIIHGARSAVATCHNP